MRYHVDRLNKTSHNGAGVTRVWRWGVEIGVSGEKIAGTGAAAAAGWTTLCVLSMTSCYKWLKGASGCAYFTAIRKS